MAERATESRWSNAGRHGRTPVRWRCGSMAERATAVGPVLIVDDDAVFVDLVGRQLEAHGFSVVTSDSVAPCGRLLADGLRPGLLMLDINLPDESGWSLLRDASLAAAGSPPVVIVSGTQ